jgi:hypothetical protein
VPGVILPESCAQAATVMPMALPRVGDGLGCFAGIEENALQTHRETSCHRTI